jgi:hypothetical protein
VSDAEGLPTLEEIDALMRSAVRAGWMTDRSLSMLEERLTAREEIICAGWPRRVFLARRLRRAIRASIKGVPGHDFADRRVSAISFALYEQEDRRRKK